MPSNNSNNSVKYKINGYELTFSNSINKWVVKKGNQKLLQGNFKECRKYCKIN